jgi:hypothetical protein
MSAISLWPNDLTQSEPVRTPIHMLREQATSLGQMTNGLVLGEVDIFKQEFTRNQITLVFNLRVPTLDDYRYELFRISHSVDGYPAELSCEKPKIDKGIENEDQLKDELKKIFNASETKRIIRTLIGLTSA